MVRERSDAERILYAVDSPPFIRTRRQELIVNKGLIEGWFAAQLKTIEAIIDVHYALHCQHWWGLRQFPANSAADKVGLASAHRNQYALFSSLELLRAGLSGAASPIYRYIFESQCIAKFCRLQAAAALGNKWLAGQQISLGKAVLKHLPVQLKQHLKPFWSSLNTKTHATVFALQDSPFAEDNRDAIEADLAVFTMLLAFEFHMLSKHTYASQLKAYVRQYNGRKEIAQLLNEARRLHRAASPLQSAPAQKVKAAFASSWYQ